jgi:hypothetical protein
MKHLEDKDPSDVFLAMSIAAVIVVGVIVMLISHKII